MTQPSKSKSDGCDCRAVVLDNGQCDGCGRQIVTGSLRRQIDEAVERVNSWPPERRRSVDVRRDPNLAWIWNHPPAEEVVAGLQRAAERAICATSAVPGYSPISPGDGNDAPS